MFSWLQKILFRLYDRCAPEDSYDLYKPRERLIYSYFDGRQIVKADPIYLYKRLMARGPEIDIDRKVAASESKGALQAHDSLVSKLREVFEVKSLQEGGLTDSEITTLLDHYLTYTEILKKKWNPSLTSSASLVDSAASSAESRPTSSISAFGSTAKEPFSVNAGRSLTEQPSASV